MMRIRNILTILLLLLFFGVEQSSNAQFRPRGGPSSAEIQARAAQLNPPDKDIPEAAQLLFQESQRLEEEIRDLKNARGTTDAKRDLTQLEEIRKEVSATVAEVSKLDCNSAQAPQLGRLTLSLGKVDSYVQRKYFFANVEAPQPNPWAAAPWMFGDKPKFDKEFCENLKTFVGDASSQQGLLGYLDKLFAAATADQQSLEQYGKAVDGLVDLLEKRKAAVQAKLNAKSTQGEIGEKLWLVILVIGAFSIGAILAVKLFVEQIQMEWVASGQVIQFVTVMVLLSAVMALGLANILKENTLGTLLGGIAGYVLAQGVGRAAAREVQRGRKDDSEEKSK